MKILQVLRMVKFTEFLGPLRSSEFQSLPILGLAKPITSTFFHSYNIPTKDSKPQL